MAVIGPAVVTRPGPWAPVRVGPQALTDRLLDHRGPDGPAGGAMTAARLAVRLEADQPGRVGRPPVARPPQTMPPSTFGLPSATGPLRAGAGPDLTGVTAPGSAVVQTTETSLPTDG
jgi:hypothetical protein